MLMTLKDIQEMLEYKWTTTAYQKLRQEGVKPFTYEPTPGKGAPVSKYRKQDVLPVFAKRLEKLGKSKV